MSNEKVVHIKKENTVLDEEIDKYIRDMNVNSYSSFVLFALFVLLYVYVNIEIFF